LNKRRCGVGHSTSVCPGHRAGSKAQVRQLQVRARATSHTQAQHSSQWLVADEHFPAVHFTDVASSWWPLDEAKKTCLACLWRQKHGGIDLGLVWPEHGACQTRGVGGEGGGHSFRLGREPLARSTNSGWKTETSPASGDLRMMSPWLVGVGGSAGKSFSCSQPSGLWLDRRRKRKAQFLWGTCPTR